MDCFLARLDSTTMGIAVIWGHCHSGRQWTRSGCFSCETEHIKSSLGPPLYPVVFLGALWFAHNIWALLVCFQVSWFHWDEQYLISQVSNTYICLLVACCFCFFLHSLSGIHSGFFPSSLLTISASFFPNSSSSKIPNSISSSISDTSSSASP